MKKIHLEVHKPCAIIAILAVFGCLSLTPASAQAPSRNVILLIADGCSSEQYTFARWMKAAPLALDSILAGGVKTYIADSVVADSAPAASAYATGYRTSDKAISVGPKKETLSIVPAPEEDLPFRPLATVLEGARLLGKATGVVATSSLTHATPAAFMTHVAGRSQEQDIMKQAVHQDVDVALGGGKQALLDTSAGGTRTDGEDLHKLLQQRGYTIVENRREMQNLNNPKVFGVFAPNHMATEIDRPYTAPDQPTLEEMTTKAIELLSRDEDGFFLMVEGSQVDWACHANDPAHLASDLLMFDKAVRVALDFAAKDGNTLVLALSDHNTGGFSVGNMSSSRSYSQIKVQDLVDPIRKMKRSAFDMWKMIEPEKTASRVKEVIGEHWGMAITDEEANEILSKGERYKNSAFQAIGEVLSPTHTLTGWTSHGHVGGDVPFFAFGPGKPSGLLDAPDIARAIASALGINLDALNERLFADIAKTLPEATIAIDKTKGVNPLLRIDYKGRKAEMPLDTNVLRINGKEEMLEGLVIYAPDTDRIYVPRQVIQRLCSES